MAEWSIAAVLKTVVLRGTGGSNPSLSAKGCKSIDLQPFFYFLLNIPYFLLFFYQKVFKMNRIEWKVKWKWVTMLLIIILFMALCMHC